MKDDGNIMNAEATQTTFLEIWRDTARVEAAWKRKKDALGWTIAGMGAPAMDSMKHDFVNGLLPNRIPKYRNYENCQSVHCHAQKVELLVEDLDTTVWDQLVSTCHQKVDMEKAAQEYSSIVYQ